MRHLVSWMDSLMTVPIDIISSPVTWPVLLHTVNPVPDSPSGRKRLGRIPDSSPVELSLDGEAYKLLKHHGVSPVKFPLDLYKMQFRYNNRHQSISLHCSSMPWFNRCRIFDATKY